MDPIISTPRLKLSLVTKAERGSPEFEWLHALHSDEKATWWSIVGRAKSMEDTEKVMKGYLPTTEGEEKAYRVAYAIHSIPDSRDGSVEGQPQPTEQEGKPTQFVGLITLKSLGAHGLALPEDLTLPAAAASTTLTVELAYMFLPFAWGKGYATESVAAVFEACKRARSFWAPYEKIYVRAIVNGGNPKSFRVMDKTGMKRRGIYKWTGKIFLAGEWRTQDDLHIFGMHLLE